MNNKEGHIDHLMILYLTGQADEKEKLEFEEWLTLSESNRLVFENICKVWNENSDYDEELPGIEEKGDEIWNRSEEVFESENKKESIFSVKVFTRVAAAVTLIIMGWYVLEKYHSPVTGKKEIISTSIAWIERENKKGERKYYQLPDGSAVWLNAESTLRYAAAFADSIRKVQLDGEAYFEVKKDVTRPFLVEVYGSTVAVLGTSFNVSSYQNEKEVKVALLEGKVKVQNTEQTQMVMLRPGEELIVSKEDDILRKARFNYEDTFGWKEDILSFDGVNFTDFRYRLERWYNVQIEVRGNAPENWELRAKYKNEVLKNVLKDISFNKGFRYQIENEKIIITF